MSAIGLFSYDPVTRKERLLMEMGEEVCIGKCSRAHVQLNDIRCDSIHALIEKSDDNKKFKLIDLGSHYGTYFKGKRVEEILLKLGDRFLIGSHHIVLRKKKKSEHFVNEDDPQTRDDIRFLKLHHQTVEEKTLTSKRASRILQVSLFWGEQLLDVKTFTSGTTITLGTQKRATFAVTMSDDRYLFRPYALGRYTRKKVNLKIPPECTGLLWHERKAKSIDRVRHESKSELNSAMIPWTLNIDDRADLQFGEMTLSFRFVTQAKSPRGMVFKKPEKNLLRAMMALGLFYLFLIGFVTREIVSPPERTIKTLPKHLKKILYNAGLATALKRQRSAIGELRNQLRGRARSKEGKSKSKKTAKRPKNTKKKQVAKTKPIPKKKPPPQIEIKQVRQAPKKIDLDAIFKTAKRKSSSSHSYFSGKTTDGNTSAAIAKGGIARGRIGDGAGGGGSSVGIGTLRGVASGGALGATDYGITPSKGRTIQVREASEYEVRGGLDPNVINAIIKRYLAQIKNCYNQQLTLIPNLRGKVKVNFVIGPLGTVISAKIISTSLRNKATENCMVKRIQKWVFPKPRGGGKVGVKYPFILQTSQ